MMTIKALSLLTAENHRIVEWKIGASHGKVIVGDQDEGNQIRSIELWPTDVLIDKETNSLFIADRRQSTSPSMVTTSRDDTR